MPLIVSSIVWDFLDWESLSPKALFPNAHKIIPFLCLMRDLLLAELPQCLNKEDLFDKNNIDENTKEDKSNKNDSDLDIPTFLRSNWFKFYSKYSLLWLNPSVLDVFTVPNEIEAVSTGSLKTINTKSG